MELRKEYEAIRSRTIQGLPVPVNLVTVGTVIAAVREAVTACQALADRPPRELSDAEITSIFKAEFGRGAAITHRDVKAGRAIIAADRAKRREPESVKFRAARWKNGAIDMLNASEHQCQDWQWLEPAQEFEVKLP